MSYQDRKDIDALFDLVWDNNNNQTQFTTREEFEEFKKYIKLNYSMSAFIDALASNMDDNGIVLFENLQDGLNELETNLDGLENNLGELTLQLNGDENNVGFIGLLHQLQYNLYGEGETKENGDPYTYEDPMSDSLKGLLDSFLVQLGALSAGDTKLSATLSSLSSKLQRFSGTIDDFRDSIDPSLLETLDPYMVDLIYEIASSNEAIYQHQKTIDDTEALIGKKTDSASTQEAQDKPVTLYGRINDTTVVASQSNNSANGLLDLMYRGTGDDYNPNADPEHPADNTTLQWLGDTSTTANKVDGYVGDVSKFTEATISEALKNRADGQTAINNKIGNTTYTGSNITGAIASMQTKIGTVNFTGNSISHALNSMQTQIGTVNFNGGTVTNALKSLQTQIGTVNVNGSLTSAIESLQTNIGNVSILGNNTNISLTLHDSILTIGNVDLSHGDIGNQLYFLRKQTDDLFKATSVDEVDNDFRQLGYDYLFCDDYWYQWNSSQNKYVKMSGSDFNFLTALSSRLQSSLNNVYASNGHTHSISDISDFAHTHRKSDISDFSHSHGNITNDGKITTTPSLFSNQDYFVAVDNTTGLLSKQKMLSASSVYDNQASSYTNIGQLNQNTPQKTINNNINTALGNKQDSIPNFSLISNQTAKGMTVKVYSDGFNVYVTYEASPVTGLNTSSTNSGVTDILTISDTAYAPKIQTQVPARGQADTHRMRILADGRVQFLNGSTSATSYTVSGAFYYPLKSRIP